MIIKRQLKCAKPHSCMKNSTPMDLNAKSTEAEKIGRTIIRLVIMIMKMNLQYVETIENDSGGIAQ
jgi:hypothetical protein